MRALAALAVAGAVWVARGLREMLGVVLISVHGDALVGADNFTVLRKP